LPGHTLRIRHETAADAGAIREVVRRAFGRDDEASLVDALRADSYSRFSLVAEVDDEVVGHVLFSELLIQSESSITSALALAPVAVLPERQRQGIGSELIRRGLETCRAQSHGIVVVLGHPQFYQRFGFSSALAAGLHCAFSGKPSFMALELVAGALAGLSGKVAYPPPFGVS
jgi:putative acetyltransferase